MTRCPACTGDCRVVEGDGPEPCPVMFIGEAPGKEEDRTGRPFVGKSGQELNENYLHLARLSRDSIRLTNTVKCRPLNNRTPTEKEIRECSEHHLHHEINRCSPDLIVLMGATACSLIPEIDLDAEHGLGRMGKLFDWEGLIVPMYHPASGMHDTAMMIPLIEDFDRLGKIIELPHVWEDFEIGKNVDYRLCITAQDVIDVLQPSALSPYIAIDTETHGGSGWSFQFCRVPGRAGMITLTDQLTQAALIKFVGNEQPRPPQGLHLGIIAGLKADDPALKAFQQITNRIKTQYIFHHHPADLPILKKWFDIDIPHYLIRDTMQESYHQGNLPQGLKSLTYRLTGHRLRSYDQVVRPHSRDRVCEWLCEAINISEKDLCVTTTKQLKTKIKTIVKPGELERAYRRILKFTCQSPAYDPWVKINEFLTVDERRKEDHDHVCKSAGEIPILGIGNVPLKEAIQYGCADADFTLRCALELDKRAKELLSGDWRITDEDKDHA